MSKATYDDWDDGDFDYAAEDDYPWDDNDDDEDDWDDFDWCYECGGYGDDYFVNDEGELESACPTCPHHSNRYEDDWDD